MAGAVIRGGTVVTAEGRFVADVRVEGERIDAVGLSVRAPGDRELDASGCLVLPGGIDPHTHIEMPADVPGGAGSPGGRLFNADTWFTGTRAAAFGGTTTVIDMITPERGADPGAAGGPGPLGRALDDWAARAAQGAVVDHAFHMGVIESTPGILDEIPEMVRRGVPSFKLYMAYRARGLMLGDPGLLAVMRAVAHAGGVALVHAENGDVVDALVAGALARGETALRHHAATRPAAVEAEATARACRIAALAGCPLYLVHVTCREALEEVDAARRRGLRVLAETCTHYLLFTAGDLDRPGLDGAPWVLSPALRTSEDCEALWQALAGADPGRGVDVVSSDHCPWTWAQKRSGGERFDRVPNGAPGVEERIPMLFTFGVEEGRISLERLVALASTSPARIFGLFPRKGTLVPGADADVVVWDPAARRVWGAGAHRCGADNTPYEGLAVRGAVRHVLVRGRPVIQGGEMVGQAGWGRFVARPARAGR